MKAQRGFCKPGTRRNAAAKELLEVKLSVGWSQPSNLEASYNVYLRHVKDDDDQTVESSVLYMSRSEAQHLIERLGEMLDDHKE